MSRFSCEGELSRYSDWLRAGRSGDRIPVWARFSAPVQTGPGIHPASCTTGTGSFPGLKSGRGVTLTTHPLLVPRSWKSRATRLPTLWSTPGLYRPSVPVQYSYTSTPLSACTVQLYLYSPQCLYSTAITLLPSVPVQYSYTFTPLSACTVQLYLYSPYGPYGLYRDSVPVQ